MSVPIVMTPSQEPLTREPRLSKAEERRRASHTRANRSEVECFLPDWNQTKEGVIKLNNTFKAFYGDGAFQVDIESYQFALETMYHDNKTQYDEFCSSLAAFNRAIEKKDDDSVERMNYKQIVLKSLATKLSVSQCSELPSLITDFKMAQEGKFITFLHLKALQLTTLATNYVCGSPPLGEPVVSESEANFFLYGLSQQQPPSIGIKPHASKNEPLDPDSCEINYIITKMAPHLGLSYDDLEIPLNPSTIEPKLLEFKYYLGSFCTPAELAELSHHVQVAHFEHPIPDESLNRINPVLKFIRSIFSSTSEGNKGLIKEGAQQLDRFSRVGGSIGGAVRDYEKVTEVYWQTSPTNLEHTLTSSRRGAQGGTREAAKLPEIEFRLGEKFKLKSDGGRFWLQPVKKTKEEDHVQQVTITLKHMPSIMSKLYGKRIEPEHVLRLAKQAISSTPDSDMKSFIDFARTVGILNLSVKDFSTRLSNKKAKPLELKGEAVLHQSSTAWTILQERHCFELVKRFQAQNFADALVQYRHNVGEKSVKGRNAMHLMQLVGVTTKKVTEPEAEVLHQEDMSRLQDGLEPYKRKVKASKERKLAITEIRASGRGKTLTHPGVALLLSTAIKNADSKTVEKILKNQNVKDVIRLCGGDLTLGSLVIQACELDESHRSEQIKIVKLFMTHFPMSLSARNAKGETALHIACLESNHKLVELVLKSDKGLVQAIDYEHFTPLQVACMAGSAACIKLIYPVSKTTNTLPQRKVDARGLTFSYPEHLEDVKSTSIAAEQRLTPFQIACLNGHLDAVKVMVNLDKDIYKTLSSINATSLLLAAESRNTKLVNYILRLYGDEADNALHKTDDNGRTPLHVAILNKDAAMVRFLIREDQNANHPLALGENDWTPLELAFLTKDENVLRALVCSSKLNCNQKFKDGDTLLHKIAKMENETLASELLEVLLTGQSINVALTDKEGHTPAYVAEVAGHSSIVERLLPLSPVVDRVDTPLHHAVTVGNKTRVKELLEADTKQLNIANSEGKTALMLALERGAEKKDDEVCFELIKEIARKDPKLDKTDCNGKTAFHYAATYGNRACFLMLLKSTMINWRQQVFEELNPTLSLPERKYLKELSISTMPMKALFSAHRGVLGIIEGNRERIAAGTSQAQADDIAGSFVMVQDPDEAVEVERPEIFDDLGNTKDYVMVDDPMTPQPLVRTPPTQEQLVSVQPLPSQVNQQRQSSGVIQATGGLEDWIEDSVGDSRQRLMVPTIVDVLSMRDKKGYTPMHYAAASSASNIKDLLEGIYIPKESRVLTPKEHAEIFEVEGNDGYTFVHKASQNPNIEVLKWCATKKLVDDFNYSEAVGSAFEEPFVLIDFKPESVSGETLFHAAARANQEEHIDFLQRQLGQGLVKPNKVGITPLHIARKNHFLKVINKIVSWIKKLFGLANGGDKPSYPLHEVIIGGGAVEDFTEMLAAENEKLKAENKKKLAAENEKLEAENKKLEAEIRKLELKIQKLEAGNKITLASEPKRRKAEIEKCSADNIKRMEANDKKALIAEPVDLNARNEKGDTLLHAAIGCGNIALALYLIKNEHVDASLPDANGWSAIDYINFGVKCIEVPQGWDGGELAQADETYHLLAELIESKKCPLPESAKLKQMVLFYTNRKANQVVEAILESNKDFDPEEFHEDREKDGIVNTELIKLKDEGGDSLLHIAVCKNSPSLVKTLVKHGADLSALGARGETPLHTALHPEYYLSEAEQEQAKQNKVKLKVNLTLLDALLDAKEQPSIFERDMQGRTAVHLAVVSGDTEALKKVLSTKQIDFDYQIRAIKGSEDGELLSAQDVFTEIRTDVGIDQRDKTGCTAAHYAMLQPNKEMLAFLYHEGADLGLRCYENRFDEDTQKVKRVLIVDPSGDEPIQKSEFSEDVSDEVAGEINELIKKAVLDPKFPRDENGNTVLHILSQKLMDLDESSKDYDKKKQELLSQIDYLLSTPKYCSAAFVSAQNTAGDSAFHFVVKQCMETKNKALIDVIRRLTRLPNLNFCQQDADGKTVVHLIAASKNAELNREVIQSIPWVVGLDEETITGEDEGKTALEIADKDGNLPIHIASMYGNQQLVATVQAYLPHQLKEKGQCDCTPLMLALINHREGVFYSLLEHYQDDAEGLLAYWPKGIDLEQVMLESAWQKGAINDRQILQAYQEQYGQLDSYLACLALGDSDALRTLTDHPEVLKQIGSRLYTKESNLLHIALIGSDTDSITHLLGLDKDNPKYHVLESACSEEGAELSEVIKFDSHSHLWLPFLTGEADSDVNLEQPIEPKTPCFTMDTVDGEGRTPIYLAMTLAEYHIVTAIINRSKKPELTTAVGELAPPSKYAHEQRLFLVEEAIKEKISQLDRPAFTPEQEREAAAKQKEQTRYEHLLSSYEVFEVTKGENSLEIHFVCTDKTLGETPEDDKNVDVPYLQRQLVVAYTGEELAKLSVEELVKVPTKIEQFKARLKVGLLSVFERFTKAEDIPKEVVQKFSEPQYSKPMDIEQRVTYCDDRDTLISCGYREDSYLERLFSRRAESLQEQIIESMVKQVHKDILAEEATKRNPASKIASVDDKAEDLDDFYALCEQLIKKTSASQSQDSVPDSLHNQSGSTLGQESVLASDIDAQRKSEVEPDSNAQASTATEERTVVPEFYGVNDDEEALAGGIGRLKISASDRQPSIAPFIEPHDLSSMAERSKEADEREKLKEGLFIVGDVGFDEEVIQESDPQGIDVEAIKLKIIKGIEKNTNSHSESLEPEYQRPEILQRQDSTESGFCDMDEEAMNSRAVSPQPQGVAEARLPRRGSVDSGIGPLDDRPNESGSAEGVAGKAPVVLAKGNHNPIPTISVVGPTDLPSEPPGNQSTLDLLSSSSDSGYPEDTRRGRQVAIVDSSNNNANSSSVESGYVGDEANRQSGVVETNGSKLNFRFFPKKSAAQTPLSLKVPSFTRIAGSYGGHGHVGSLKNKPTMGFAVDKGAVLYGR